MIQDPIRARRWLAGFALLLLALGAALAAGTALLPVSPAYSMIGPKLFPGLIAGGLCLVGAGLLVAALRPRSPETAAPMPRLDPVPMIVVTAGLFAQLLLIDAAGFVLASTVLFVAVAFAFGSRRLLRNLVIALVLTSAAYFGFTSGLGLSLPAGPFGLSF